MRTELPQVRKSSGKNSSRPGKSQGIFKSEICGNHGELDINNSNWVSLFVAA